MPPAIDILHAIQLCCGQRYELIKPRASSSKVELLEDRNSSTLLTIPLSDTSKDTTGRQFSSVASFRRVWPLSIEDILLTLHRGCSWTTRHSAVLRWHSRLRDFYIHARCAADCGPFHLHSTTATLLKTLQPMKISAVVEGASVIAGPARRELSALCLRPAHSLVWPRISW